MKLAPPFPFPSLALLCLLPGAPTAQSLELSSAAASPGGLVRIELTLDSPHGKEPRARTLSAVPVDPAESTVSIHSR